MCIRDRDIVLSSETQNVAQVQAEFMTDINDTSCGDHLKDSDVIESRMVVMMMKGLICQVN